MNAEPFPHVNYLRRTEATAMLWIPGLARFYQIGTAHFVFSWLCDEAAAAMFQLKADLDGLPLRDSARFLLDQIQRPRCHRSIFLPWDPAGFESHGRLLPASSIAAGAWTVEDAVFARGVYAGLNEALELRTEN